jgi:hypothetical protein
MFYPLVEHYLNIEQQLNAPLEEVHLRCQSTNFIRLNDYVNIQLGGEHPHVSS